MMSLDEISVFIQVVRSGSFSGAAKVLDMPHSTVSFKVSSLEKRLGVTLLQRSTRKLKITPLGQQYFEQCSRGLEEIMLANQSVSQESSLIRGQLRITAPVELGSFLLPEIVKEYTSRYPQVNLDIILSDQQMDLLSTGIDLAIRVGPLKDSSMKIRKLGTVSFGLFASKAYIKSRPNIREPKDLLGGHNCLHFSAFSQEQWNLQSHKSQVSLRISSSLKINDLNTLKNMAQKGLGVALLPLFLCKGELARGSLVRVLPDWKTQDSPVHFVHTSQKFLTPKLRSFIDVSAGLVQRQLSEI